MYKTPQHNTTQLKINKSVEGETIEMKIDRVVNNKEPIKDGAPLIYTPRKDGVKPATNIRTDRWEIAQEAMGKIEKSYKARREERILERERESNGVTNTRETASGSQQSQQTENQ